MNDRQREDVELRVTTRRDLPFGEIGERLCRTLGCGGSDGTDVTDRDALLDDGHVDESDGVGTN